MKKIKEILNRKRQGVDCTEQESAEIKMFLKEHLIQVGTGDVQLVEQIQTLFPLEYGESTDELNNIPTFAIGEVLGTKAFNNGIKRAPYLDEKIHIYIEEKQVGDMDTIKLLKGWLFGWDNANINEYIKL
jgi:hypothetical protein